MLRINSSINCIDLEAQYDLHQKYSISECEEK